MWGRTPSLRSLLLKLLQCVCASTERQAVQPQKELSGSITSSLWVFTLLGGDDDTWSAEHHKGYVRLDESEIFKSLPEEP